jgi:hypothetical protein
MRFIYLNFFSAGMDGLQPELVGSAGAGKYWRVGA